MIVATSARFRSRDGLILDINLVQKLQHLAFGDKEIIPVFVRLVAGDGFFRNQPSVRDEEKFIIHVSKSGLQRLFRQARQNLADNERLIPLYGLLGAL